MGRVPAPDTGTHTHTHTHTQTYLVSGRILAPEHGERPAPGQHLVVVCRHQRPAPVEPARHAPRPVSIARSADTLHATGVTGALQIEAAAEVAAEARMKTATETAPLRHSARLHRPCCPLCLRLPPMPRRDRRTCTETQSSSSPMKRHVLGQGWRLRWLPPEDTARPEKEGGKSEEEGGSRKEGRREGVVREEGVSVVSHGPTSKLKTDACVPYLKTTPAITRILRCCALGSWAILCASRLACLATYRHDASTSL